MILQPLLHPVLLVLLCGAAAALAVHALLTRPGDRGRWGLRLGIVLALFLLLLRPGIPGGQTETMATDTDIVIVLDTTASMVAEDGPGGGPRLAQVREDVEAIVAAYPGARFALLTFDAEAVQRLPLTTDTSALASALQVLQPEVTAHSRGSSVWLAADLLAQTLQQAAESTPDRARMVFYLGDGEQTASSAPGSFASAGELADGGAVLGYGTAEGGPMRITSGRVASGGSDTEYIQYQGQRALSTIDEETLGRIAADLGVTYQHRGGGEELVLPEPPATTVARTGSDTPGGVIELTWMLALLFVVLLAVEIAIDTARLVRLRGLLRPEGGPMDETGPRPVTGGAAPMPSPAGGPSPSPSPSPAEARPAASRRPPKTRKARGSGKGDRP